MKEYKPAPGMDFRHSQWWTFNLCEDECHLREVFPAYHCEVEVFHKDGTTEVVYSDYHKGHTYSSKNPDDQAKLTELLGAGYEVGAEELVQEYIGLYLGGHLKRGTNGPWATSLHPAMR